MKCSSCSHAAKKYPQANSSNGQDIKTAKLYCFHSFLCCSLKLECEKLATEKTEIQRHYVMYYEMSYGLNIEMHKQVSQLQDSLFVLKLCIFLLYYHVLFALPSISSKTKNYF
uniref:Groucho/TLE N-terminal Q-rich domain-containing protein n=1 Tax=Amphilophus citrinellus TaxID=61819 RepID=A0A3Q0S4M9_AMPCI